MFRKITLLKLLVLVMICIGKVQASVPSESEFLTSTTSPVVEAYYGNDEGQGNTGLDLASFGNYWVDNQAVASVWRIRNSRSYAQIIVLSADGQGWQTTFTVPANTQIYVSSPKIYASHTLIFGGTHLCNRLVESQLAYYLPQQPIPTQPGHALLTQDLANGQSGGANTGQTWTRRDLNTEAYDTGDFVVVNGGQFTLQPGTYLIEANQTFFGHVSIQKNFKGRLRNINDNSTVAVSLNTRLHIASGESASIDSAIPKTHFTIEEAQTFELQYFAESAQSDPYGLGYRVASGEVERYAYVYISKLN